ncbi:MAG: hypothetical protein IJU51_07170 [Clostridia bacterium]|nr:hypothetical protein [Clostridia bacterium]
MVDKTELKGNWEQRGVNGTRIEINENRITVLWMSAVVLSTTFEICGSADGGTELLLNDRGLKNPGYSESYATVERLIYNNGQLRFVKNFDISGLSEETLTRTENSRYGNVTIKDELLDTIQGSWVMQGRGSGMFTIEGNRLTIGADSFVVRAAVNNGCSSRGESFAIINRDPAVKGMGYYSEMLCFGDEIRAYIMVCDLGMQELKFKRK